MTGDATTGPALHVLGGGTAAVTAALHLSSGRWTEHGFERWWRGPIHLYEMRPRLGGKGASVRRSTPAVTDRIEEHGLHIWFGFYRNAFRLLRMCHDELDTWELHGTPRWSTALRTMDDGFRPASTIAVMDSNGGGWRPWVANFPLQPGCFPWDDVDSSHATGDDGDWPIAPLVRRSVELALAFARSTVNGEPWNAWGAVTLGHAPAVRSTPPPGRFAFAWRLLGEAERALAAIDPDTRRGLSGATETAVALAGRVAREARDRADELLRDHDELRRSWYLVDLLLAVSRGALRHRITSVDELERLDGYELREWLLLHGARRESVGCGLLKALVYDLAFAYERGDADRPRCAAGTALKGMFRVLFTYRGALMWKMNAGMGEVVFAPIYELLLKRGVQVHLLHRLDAVDVDHAGVHALHFAVPAEAERAATTAGPLPTIDVDSPRLVGTLPYWPPGDGPPLVDRHTVTVGPEDHVVFGLPVGTIAHIGGLAEVEGLRRAAGSLGTVATQALQTWLPGTVTQLGEAWTADVTVGAYVEPFDTWSDMAHLAGERPGPEGAEPMTTAYFTSVLPDGGTAEDAVGNAKAFLDHDTADLWPGARASWPGTPLSEVCLDTYVTANVAPTDRYSLSLPGTTVDRPHPGAPLRPRLRAVGDWTANIVNAGCIEAAVISGMRAARAIAEEAEIGPRPGAREGPPVVPRIVGEPEDAPRRRGRR